MQRWHIKTPPLLLSKKLTNNINYQKLVCLSEVILMLWPWFTSGIILIYFCWAPVETPVWHLLRKRPSNCALSLTSFAPYWLLSRVSLIVVFFPLIICPYLECQRCSSPVFPIFAQHCAIPSLTKSSSVQRCTFSNSWPKLKWLQALFYREGKEGKGDSPAVFHDFTTILSKSIICFLSDTVYALTSKLRSFLRVLLISLIKLFSCKLYLVKHQTSDMMVRLNWMEKACRSVTTVYIQWVV